MACIQCGCPDVDDLRYCQPCIDQRRNAKQNHKQATIEGYRKEDSRFDQITQNPITWVAAGSASFLILFVVFLFVGPVSGKGIVASFLFSAILMSIFVTAISAWMIKVKRGIGKLDFWECKAFYGLNFGAIGTGLLCSLLLSMHLNMTFSEARKMVEDHLHGGQLTQLDEHQINDDAGYLFDEDEYVE